MKKQNILLCAILSSISLSACNSTPVDSSSPSTSQEASSEAYVESSKVEEVSSEIVSSEEVNNSSNSEVDEYGYIKNDSLIEYESIDIGVNEKYNIGALYEDQTAIFDILVEDKDIAVADVDDCINGLKEGTTKLKFIVDDTYYDEVTINVKSEEYMNQNMKLDKGRLYGRSFTVFGDSISDVKVTAYPDNRPDFWCEQLVRKYNMKMYNEAISGSTTGYCKGLLSKDPGYISIVGTMVVNKDNVKEELKNSDYAFIYFGNNDATYKSVLGQIGEIDDENYQTTESLRGAYSYLIDKIRATNPKIKIICLSMSFSSWSAQNERKEANDAIKEVIESKKCKYIDIFTLWNGSNMNVYCPDGIHPQTAGYDLIVEKILNS